MMKELNKLLGLAIAVLVIGFGYVWTFVPEKKHAIQDWWYGFTIDCVQLQRDVANHQRCQRSADCELSRRESARAEEMALQYQKYCSRN